MANKQYLSTIEAAKLLGISRIAVFKKIKAGDLKAEKIGRNYAILKSEITSRLQPELSKTDKDEIDQAVKKTVREYGETLKLLGHA
ncbi:MAG: helix-turn-helix domain-containing protein [Patescibacteria group bacterium]|nr:helix-turn-helix domain-containing protein [Patescibacteria group bacterium]